MNTKEIVKTIENLTGLCFEISINDNQTEVTSTFNPEKINYEYFNVCNELESYFTELYLDSNNLILERILYLLNDGLKLDFGNIKGFCVMRSNCLLRMYLNLITSFSVHFAVR